jgi:DNA replication and repair protein RecF
LRDVLIELDPGFNFVYGDNGAGKTALLEAVYLLARGRSFRGGRVAALINREADALAVRAAIPREGQSDLDVVLRRTRQGETTIRIDGRNESRISEIARALPVQLLLPGVAELIFGGPGGRRSYLDWGLFHVEQPYLVLSRQYRRILSQRNAWLKTLAGSLTSIDNDPWLNQLIDVGCRIGAMRRDYLELLRSCVHEVLADLEPEIEFGLEYRDGGYLDGKAQAHKKMSDSLARDVKFATTHSGPHRADLRFSMGAHPASEVASRGQAKLIASAAVLGQALHLQRSVGRPSVILIDDFGAELDARHWYRYLQVLLDLDCQVIATSTEKPGSEGLPAGVSVQMFHVEHGEYRTD